MLLVCTSNYFDSMKVTKIVFSYWTLNRICLFDSDCTDNFINLHKKKIIFKFCDYDKFSKLRIQI